MELHVTGLVLLAAVLHAGWNAVVKTGEDRALTMAMVIGLGSILALPVLPFVAVPAEPSWVFLLLSVLLHVGYFFFLLQAYKVGDLSHVYPVARGAAPLLVAAPVASRPRCWSRSESRSCTLRVERRVGHMVEAPRNRDGQGRP